jgi:hypothetical protein
MQFSEKIPCIRQLPAYYVIVPLIDGFGDWATPR